MYLLLSGEGPTDMGCCDPASNICGGADFKEGPMAIIVDQLVEQFQGFDYSHIQSNRVQYVSEKYLDKNKLPPKRKPTEMKGKKRPPETRYFFNNARALSTIAKGISKQVEDKVIAVLFRDADGTASSDRGDWKTKRESILKGFDVESYALGVAMIPKPKSEAWLLCATKPHPYQHCDRLEYESGNDNSPNSLKDQLSNALNGKVSRDNLNQLLRDGAIDVQQINMPSFSAFKSDLKQAVDRATNPSP